jgi:antitoxin component YwqK of YwqJK toxin-antitoxin module
MIFFIRVAAIVALALTHVALYAQQVDSIELNGESRYVYPFKIESQQSGYYWKAVDGANLITQRFRYEDIQDRQRMEGVPDSLRMSREDFDNFIKALNANSYRVFKKYYDASFGRMPTKQEFKEFKKIRKSGMRMLESDNDAKIWKSKKLARAIRANPYPFLFQQIDLDQDIIPMLDPIPDGDYIQLYEPFCLVKEDGTCNYIEDQVAGYFQIKDNALHGEATWVDLKGDTIKHGYFNAGLKQGEWTIVRKELGYFDSYAAEHFVKTGEIEITNDTRIVSFNEGIRNGSYIEKGLDGKVIETGQYKDGYLSGEWTSYWEYTEAVYLDSSGGNLAIREHFVYNEDDSLIVRPFVIRDGLLPTWEHDPEDYNFYSLYDIPRLPTLYTPAFEVKENFELNEELFDDSFSEMEYYGEEYYEEEYYDEYGYEGGEWGTSYFQRLVRDPNDRNRKERGILFDSLGARPKFRQFYERYYRNGQLAYRYEFDNGKLREEPVIYWDNGNVHDEIVYIADSNHYVRTIYDYDGKEFASQLYDSSGRYKHSNVEFSDMEQVTIEGLTFNYGPYDNQFQYRMEDSLLGVDPNREQLLFKDWHLMDTSVISERYFNPETHTATYYKYNILGDTLAEAERIYSDGFESWTGAYIDYAGDYTLKTIRSASLHDWAEVDSVPIHMVNKSRLFKVNYDYTLHYDHLPYTGPMELSFGGKKLKLDKNVVRIPSSKKTWDKFVSAVEDYRLTGNMKKRYVFDASVLENGLTEYENFNYVYRELFSGFFNRVFQSPRNAVYLWKDESFSSDDDRAYTAKLEGYFLNGKPEGPWKSYDQFGKIKTIAHFKNGMLDGVVQNYGYALPSSEEDYYYRESEDSLPYKKTYYLKSESTYNNDKLEGTAYEYTWYGDVVLEENFKEGYRDGITIERNEKAVSYSEFKDGVRDGYSRTYLTLPGKDSILLFDLNFQNGALQGESISYHTNGKISKRGFFLTGEPIEDYEGFDTLGFRYHYVKFEYGFPVEEKLWEENELSVRYQFNWEDSIVFVPLNFTDSESLDALLVEAGLSDGWEYQPYYGRRTIVNKEGVDYHLTKYYPNDTISRQGAIVSGKKSGYWEFFDYDGVRLYDVNYFDTLLEVNDSIKFNAKGIYTQFNEKGDELFRAYIIEKSERFDCSHKDHYEIRQYYTIAEANDSIGRMNGEVTNYYDNGTLQSYGTMKDGLPHGEWRYYDPAGKLNKYGTYVQGKRDGRWLMGDLSKTKYLGDICLNPNMPDVEEELRFRENFLDIQIINYQLGQEKNREYYDINMNQFIEDEEPNEE